MEQHTSRATKRWINIPQMLDHFKSETIVSSIVAGKKKPNKQEMRPNKDAPNDETANECLCVVLDEVCEEHVWLREKITELEAELSNRTAGSIIPNRIRKPVWAGGLTPTEKLSEEEKSKNEQEQQQKEEDKRLKAAEKKRLQLDLNFKARLKDANRAA